MELNLEQHNAVKCTDDAVVTACPGSGKTRVLTARIIRGVGELQSTRTRVLALTFTNRAADEIRTRLDRIDTNSNSLWAGTIHSFALEWIIRPYAPYADKIRYGFSLADEFYCRRLFWKIKSDLGLAPFVEINTRYERDGSVRNRCEKTDHAFDLYQRELRSAKLIDYDEVLYFAYCLLTANNEIASNIGAVFRLICVDEVQDIQDLQFGILSEIYQASPEKPTMFFVGDSNQSIYESLGALSKSPEEIANEFAMDTIEHFELVGNYRSTQRIVNFCGLLRQLDKQVTSRIQHPDEQGIISFENQTLHKDELAARITELVQSALDSGVSEKDICIIAPQWAHLITLARSLVESLPDVSFDAPGLSPLYSVRDSLWFNLARLCLTEPVHKRIRSRARWASELLADLEFLLESQVPESINSARRLLRMVNQMQSTETEGLPYLRDLFNQFLDRTEISLQTHEALKASFDLFFDKAENRLSSSNGSIPTSLDSFKTVFNYPSGVVINTCHGVKGEEYDTVIAFGLLRGYVPHWSVIFEGTDDEAAQRESKLMYVITSRAKRQLHLIAEAGRTTQSGRPYQTCSLLAAVDFDYD